MPGFDLEPTVSDGAQKAFERISDRVRGMLTGDESVVASFSCKVHGVEWGVLVDPIALEDGSVVGALVVARHGRTWSPRERSLPRAFASLLSHVATLATREGAAPAPASPRRAGRPGRRATDVGDRRLIARRSSTGSARSSPSSSALTSRSFAATTCARGLTILEAEWPIRVRQARPRPAGRGLLRRRPDLHGHARPAQAPYLTGAEDINDDYSDRSMEAAGVAPADGRGRATPAR